MRACRDHRHGLQDKVLDARLLQMRTWNTARFIVSVLLAIGLVATLVSAYGNQLPGTSVVRAVVAVSTAITGALSLAYLFLTRLLGQLEIDILARLTLERKA